MLQLFADRCAGVFRAIHVGALFDTHGQRIEMAVFFDDDLIVRNKLRDLANQFLDLRRKHVDAANDEHVIGSSGNLVDAAH